jgi:hypothetical protein
MNNLMTLPVCPADKIHGQMGLREIKFQTPEQRYCGVWYDCLYPGCSCSTLMPSSEIKQIYGNRLTT